MICLDNKNLSKKIFRKNFSIFRMRQSVFQKWRRESGIFLKLRYMFVQNIFYRIRGYFSDPLIFQRSFFNFFFLGIDKTWKSWVELKRVFENFRNLQKNEKKSFKHRILAMNLPLLHSNILLHLRTQSQ